jgi:hypothetical protein
VSRADSPVLGFAIIFVVLFALSCAGMQGAVWIAEARCGWKTDGLNLPHRYKVGAGCQVQTPDTGWVSLEALRVLR